MEKPKDPQALQGRVVAVTESVRLFACDAREGALSRGSFMNWSAVGLQGTVDFEAERGWLALDLDRFSSLQQENACPLVQPGAVKCTLFPWELVTLLDQAEAYRYGHLSSEQLLKRFAEATVRAGVSGSGLVIDVSHSSNVSEYERYHEEVLRRLKLGESSLEPKVLVS